MFSILPTLPVISLLLLITLVSPHRKFECVTLLTDLTNSFLSPYNLFNLTSMEKSKVVQIAKKIEKSISNWDVKKAIAHSNDEAKTRDYLVEPFFKILGYREIDDYSHEYSLKHSKGVVKKVDMVIFLSKKEPSILIECKKANGNLTNRHFEQLNKYYEFHKDSKIGILTNGIQYQFYSRTIEGNKALNPNPFLVFDLNNYNYYDVENLVKFYRNNIDVKEIVEDAEEIYFLEKFEEGLFKTLHKPSEEFIKLIFGNMGGKRISKRVSDRIFELVNSISMSEAVERIRLAESKESQSGVFTSAEELRAFNIVKTIIAMSSKVKDNELDRISYRDYKGFFNIIVDNSSRKSICSFKLLPNKKSVSINNESFNLDSVTVKEITNYKRQLVSSATKTLNA